MQLPEKVELAFLPTPIYKLEKLSKQFQKNIYIKRDDLTGIETSGNKIRKLEYSLREAFEQGCDLVITCGVCSQIMLVQQPMPQLSYQ